MKTVGKFLCGFSITFFTICFFLSMLYFYFTSPRFLFDVAKRSNYYEQAYNQIIQNLEKQVVNEEIKLLLPDVITKEKVNNDLNRMITSLSTKKDIYSVIQSETNSMLQKTLSNSFQTEDADSLTDLSKTFTTSYMKDLFPYQEFTKIESKLISVNHLIPISIFCFLMAFFFTLVSVFIAKKRPLELFYRSNFVSGIIMILPCFLMHLLRLFQKFYYSNAYFSLFIRKTFYIMVDLVGMFGFIVLLITILLELYEIQKKNLRRK